MVKSHHCDPAGVVQHRLPREIAEGVHWLGDCFVWETRAGLEHSYSSVYLVAGKERSILVDTGHIKDWIVVRDQVESLVAKGVPAPEFIFPTHPEVTHSGNLGRWLNYYPEARGIGDMRDMQLIFPKHVDRFLNVKQGDEIDLGGRKFVFVEAVFLDLVNSLWGYDEQEKVLFSSDGLGFGHYHEAEQCGKFAEEIPDLPIPELTGIFLEYALYWTRLKSAEPELERLRKLIEEDYPTRIIASAHGSVVTDPKKTIPLVKEGLTRISKMTVEGSVSSAKNPYELEVAK
ncbi:MBL fold metallo-hydrolase [Mesorhizobium sp. ArgA1]